MIKRTLSIVCSFCFSLVILSQDAIATPQDIVQTENLPEHAIGMIGDWRYVFPATKIRFVDNNTIAAYGNFQAGLIDVDSGEVTRLNPELPKAEPLRISRSLRRGRWLITSTRRKDRKIDVSIVDLLDPKNRRDLTFSNKVLTVSESGDFAFVPFDLANSIEVVRIDDGSIVGGWDVPDPDLRIHSIALIRYEKVLAVTCLSKNGRGRSRIYFLDYATEEGRIGKEISNILAPERGTPTFIESDDVVVFLGLRGEVVVHDFKKDITKTVAKLSTTAMSADIDWSRQRIVYSENADGIYLSNLLTGEKLLSLRSGYRTTSNVCFSPNGLMIAAALDGRIWIWESKSGELLNPLKHQSLGAPRAIAVAPKEKMVALADGRGTTEIWDCDTGKQLAMKNISVTGRYDTWPSPNFLSFSKKGDFLLGGSSKDQNVVNLWNPHSGKSIFQFKGHKQPIMGVAFSPNGSMLASVGRDSKLRVVDKNEKLIAEFDQASMSVEFLSDNRHIVTQGKHGISGLQLFDLKKKRLVRSFKHPDNSAMSWGISVSPSQEHVATAFASGDIGVWEIETGNVAFIYNLRKRSARGTRQRGAIAYSPDGQVLAAVCGGNEIHLLDPSSGELISKLEGRGTITSLAFTKNYLWSASEEHHVMIWEIPDQ